MTTQAMQRTDTTIRPATSSDFTAVERLLMQSDLPLDGVRESLTHFVVAEAGNELVGVAGLEICCDNALLRSVAVAPGWRSHGLGRAGSPRRSASSLAPSLNLTLWFANA